MVHRSKAVLGAGWWSAPWVRREEIDGGGGWVGGRSKRLWVWTGGKELGQEKNEKGIDDPLYTWDFRLEEREPLNTLGLGQFLG
ncbi:hypothetical protein E3N88_30079 [Mikania micrantha]|uniref:Uncharacterized protein n=1 Tax=Mikania micrantha TaxID=192012 RepID=A0A5N6ML97_9ASTR|nr:hypothetical protein E3N88_30079 [Mikania micrantha]